VIGAGASGTLAAVHLARAVDRVLLIEGSRRFGVGVAYGTTDDVHVLNVPAAGMSAYPDDPWHFARWARCGPGEYVARHRYASYLETALDEAGPAVERVPAHAVGAVPGRCGVVIELGDGRALGAHAAVLALGNFPPVPPAGLPPGLTASPCYVPDPWRPGALEGYPRDAPVVLIGSGLTAVDVALALVERGHRGPIDAVSRHGLLPRAHRPGWRERPVDPFPLPSGPLTLGRLLRRFREQLDATGDWREVVDSMRPVTSRVWGCLSVADQRRFLHHLARPWEVHRHRMAPSVAARVHMLVSTGRLTVSAGGVSSDVLRRAGRVVNCTGSSCDVTRRRDRLVTGLLRTGVARPGPHRLGFDVAADGALVDAQGRPSHRLFTLGPLCRGRRWETTAVPEIRVQAAALAERLSDAAPRTELV
jgi:uncharacterized NAD(P)/FAD-binding protein YdhS